MPGSGSLVAGYASGYAQLTLALLGVVVSSIFGLQFIIWQAANWSRFHNPEIDPVEALHEMWLHLRWAVLGFGIFFLGWLWALATSLAILHSARNEVIRDP